MVTAQRKPNNANASNTPFLPKIVVKQLTEKERKKPKASPVNGKKITPIEANPNKKANNGYRK